MDLSEINEQDVIANLNATTRAFRHLALELALQHGQSQELLDALQARQGNEPDAECQSLLSAAVGALQGRLHLVTPGEADSGPEAWLTTFKHAPTSDQMRLLESLDPELAPTLAREVFKTLHDKLDPRVGEKLLAVFGPHFPEELLPGLLKLLDGASLRIRAQILELLLKRTPSTLMPRLPEFLQADDPRTRTMAIRAMLSLDRREALRHLEWLLVGQSEDYKLAALNTLLMLPFQQSRGLLLQFIATEPALHLVERAGLAFKINPDPETPYRLLEIADNCHDPDKKKLMRKVAENATGAIKDSGILQGKFEAYFNRLKAWAGKRKARRYVSAVLAQHLQDPDNQNGVFLATLRGRLQNNVIRQVFVESLRWQIPDEVKAWVRDILQQGPRSTIVTDTSTSAEAKEIVQPAKLDASTFAALSMDDKIRQMATWETEHLESIQPLLDHLIGNPNTPSEILSMALRTAGRLELNHFLPVGVRYLNAADDLLAASAFDYVAAIDPEQIYPYLGQFLQSSSLRIKTRAICFLEQSDHKQAISSLMAMLRSSGTKTDSGIIPCLVQFDFPLIRDQLTEFLISPLGYSMIEKALFLFEANPDPDNLRPLLRLERSLGGQKSARVQETRLSLGRLLVSIGRLSEAELETLTEKLLKEFQQEAKAPVEKPYAITQMRPEAASYFEPEEITLGEKLTLLWQNAGFSERALALAAILIILPSIAVYHVSEIRTQNPVFLPPEAITNYQPGMPMSGRVPETAHSQSSGLTSGSTQQQVADELEAMGRFVEESRSKPEIPAWFSPKARQMAMATENPAYNDALAALDLGDLKAAEKLLEQALGKGPNNPFLQVMVFDALCVIYDRQNNPSKLKNAFKNYRKALARLPRDFTGPYLNSLKQLKLQFLYLEQLPDMRNLKPETATKLKTLGTPALRKLSRRTLEALGQ